MTQASRLQFSIRLMLAATAMIAAGVAAIRVEPSRQSSLAIDCLTVLYATTAFIGLAHTNGKARTFWIGTACLLGPAAVRAVDGIMDQLNRASVGGGVYLFHSPVWQVWCAAPVNGLLAVFLHRLFWPRLPESHP